MQMVVGSTSEWLNRSVTFREGRIAASDGQLAPELRSRDQSGFLDHLHSLRQLIAGVGPPCWVDGPTAAALYGIRGYALKPPFHLLIGRDRYVHRVGHYIRQTIELAPIDRESSHGLAAVSPTRALINMARMESAARLDCAVGSAIELGLTSEELLHRRLLDLRSSGRHGLPRLLSVIESRELAAGTESWLEREFLRLVDTAHLPRPVTQQVLGRRKDRLIRVDFRWPDTTVVVEVLGYRWHRTIAQMAADAERMNQLALSGFLCLQFTYSHVATDAKYVLNEVGRALEPFV
jgi:very-short-patch-repair endonuclease